MQIKDGALLKAYNSDLINGALAIPDGIHTIGMLAFDSCENLTTIIIPECVTTIDKFAFCSCENLTTVTI